MQGIEKIVDWMDAAGIEYRKTGADSYMACCPAHVDRSPSLSLKSLHDGRVLLHCFAGCSWEEILFVMDMEPAEIMPPENNYRPVKTAVKRAEQEFINDVLVLVAESAISRGERLSESDKQAVMEAKLQKMRGNDKAPWEQ